MRLRALIVMAGKKREMYLFACAPPTPPAGGVAAPPPPTIAATCSPLVFLSKVHFLAQTSPPFSLPDSGFQNAPPTDFTAINTTIVQDLTDAFNAAPDFFKNQ